MSKEKEDLHTITKKTEDGKERGKPLKKQQSKENSKSLPTEKDVVGKAKVKKLPPPSSSSPPAEHDKAKKNKNGMKSAETKAKKEDDKDDAVDDEKKSKDEKGKNGNGKKDKFHELPSLIQQMIPKTKTDKIKAITKVIDKQQALEQAQEKMKEFEEQCLTKARAEVAKQFEIGRKLPNMKDLEYRIFKVILKIPPPPIENKPTQNEKSTNLHTTGKTKITVKDISLQDVLYQIKKEKKESDTQQRKHKAKYGIASSKRRRVISSLGIDSDLELDIESLTKLIKEKTAHYKILNTSIVRNIPEKRKPTHQPLQFHAVEPKDTSESLQIIDLEKEELKVEDVSQGTPGILRYALSDPTFINKGWTLLPTEKVMRKMNIYRVRPTNPEFDWFNNNRKKGNLYYDTGEILANFDEDGRSRLYYKNGRLALDYYDCEEANAQQRFVIYSSGESNEHCRTLPVSVLAMFDYLGSGVVFDHSGKIRIKYNQTEGIVLDRGIGPKNRWKWHTLNDPPVLKQVMIDTHLEHPDPVIMKLGDGTDKTRPVDEEMLEIELDNFIREKTNKLNQNFQPFQIKMKALKINDQFSLKILDQAHVYLNFMDGTTHLKMNLGMILDNQEIIDTDTLDYTEVENSLERLLPKTASLLDLQAKIKHTRHLESKRAAHDEMIRPTIPKCSADKLIAAVSKPLRPVMIGTCPNSCPNQISEAANNKRKPSLCNMYYATRLV
ncbi:hypothetical protein O0L34_g3574 [Tuta absoluta]|nr:hypothetical protein O0L34_g3574 [Tuta absoluta]